MTTFEKENDSYIMSSTLSSNAYMALISYDSNLEEIVDAEIERCFGIPARGVTKTDLTGITNYSNDNKEEIIGYYDMQGRKLNAPTKGVNIIKYKNGSTKKIIK
jgi:hypothetical protein